MSEIKKAVIVAAGLSTRLHPLTKDLPKGLLTVGGETILGRSVRLLRGAGIDEVLLVVGCKGNLTNLRQIPPAHHIHPFHLCGGNG